MFNALTEKFQNLFAQLSGERKLTESNIADAVREVRLALLEADVHYDVVKILIKRIKEKAIGEGTLKSISAGQQFIKIVHDELVALMGDKQADLKINRKPAVIMMCGLQGSGKTTQSVKLAHYLKKSLKCKNPLLVAADLQRPAAVDQLKTLGNQAGIAVFSLKGECDPLVIARSGLIHASKEQYDLIIIDTAGRLHIDEELMMQLEKMKSLVSPDELIFVANAATGQDAVTTATEFDRRLSMTGTILTMLDSDARGGAAISIAEITGKPLLFEGIGEKIADLQPFNPSSMADRILGMGDTINLVRKVEEHIDKEEAKKLEKKILKATFSYEDYLSQIQMVKKMGSFSGLLGMLPGMSQLKAEDLDEKEFYKVEAIIQSMTPQERQERCELSVPRRKRIARGSGTTIDDINRLVKSFKKAKQFFKNMPSNIKNLQKMMGGVSWR